MKSKNKSSVKNTVTLKHGAVSILITVLVLAVIIAFNWAFAFFADKYDWQIDTTKEKIHSMDKENIKYLKSLDKEIGITVIAASKSEYAQYMSTIASQSVEYGGYGVLYGDSYYEQTANIVEKYGSYNKNIKVRFIDPQSTEFTEINSKYADLDIAYGDILVNYQLSDGEERIKKIGFDDIYNYDTDSYSSSTYVTSNNIENALTNAITYVISGESKKLLLITGHSTNDNTANYVNLLKLNGYEIEIEDARLLAEIPEDTNLVAILSPSEDFYESELNVLSEFLENDGKLDKGLICFADASSPMLPNFYGFLEEWGIEIKEGKLFENADNRRNPADASQLTMSMGEDSITTTGMKNGTFVAAYNVPMTTRDPDGEDGTQYEIANLVVTSDTTVIAPIDANNSWKPESRDDEGQYVAAAASCKVNYDEENKPHTSYVVAFSSVQFIQSTLAEYSTSDNKDVVLYCSDLAANVTEGEVRFITKEITNESYSDVTEKDRNVLSWIFVGIIPALVVAAGIFVVIWRRIA